MEPKFQSSFIPRGPVASVAINQPLTKRKTEHSLLGFLAGIIFTLSVVAALGAVGYKWWLGRSIINMKAELEAGKAAIDQETVAEITRLNNRIIAAENLINKHRVVSPLFRFLESTTIKNVRFTDFTYTADNTGLKVLIKGQAKSYTALALQAEAFNKSDYVKNSAFSDIRLDDKGNVTFSVLADVDPGVLSYRKEVERAGASLRPLATTTPAVATSTSRTSTSTATTTQR